MVTEITDMLKNNDRFTIFDFNFFPRIEYVSWANFFKGTAAPVACCAASFLLTTLSMWVFSLLELLQQCCWFICQGLWHFAKTLCFQLTILLLLPPHPSHFLLKHHILGAGFETDDRDEEEARDGRDNRDGHHRFHCLSGLCQNVLHLVHLLVHLCFICCFIKNLIVFHNCIENLPNAILQLFTWIFERFMLKSQTLSSSNGRPRRWS